MIGIIKKLFNRENNYYIELDENESPAKNSQGTQQSQTQTQQQQTQQQTQPSAKTEQATPQKPSQSTQPSTQPSTVQSSAEAVQAQNNGQVQTTQTFAPENLTPKATTPRRRPGKNMNEFMELARQVNIPRTQ